MSSRRSLHYMFTRRSLPAVMVTLVAAAIAVEGTALGARVVASIRSANIVDGTIQNRDIKSGTIQSAKLTSAARASLTDTSAEILTKLQNVDGPGSGLNADSVDGVSSDTLLRSDQAMPMVRLTRTTFQTISNNASFGDNAIQFTSESYDSNMHEGSDAIVTVPRNGVYTTSCSVGFTANGTGTRAIAISTNTGNIVSSSSTGTSSPSSTAGLHVSGDINLTAGQTLQCGVFQNSGGDLNTAGNADFSVGWVGPIPS